jgi:hypothetical protein
MQKGSIGGSSGRVSNSYKGTTKVKEHNVFVVHLRRPKSRRENPKEMRSDPFWEFGSFGITKCHRTHLMNRRHVHELEGARLAFAQGGKQGTRLVHLTPPVKIIEHPDCIEARWTPKEMPFRYASAPILISNQDDSDFPEFGASIEIEGRRTVEGQFSSNFRSLTKCIESRLAGELIKIYTRKRRQAPQSAIASGYADALPWRPPTIDPDRKATYKRLLGRARQPGMDGPCFRSKACPA